MHIINECKPRDPQRSDPSQPNYHNQIRSVQAILHSTSKTLNATNTTKSEYENTFNSETIASTAEREMKKRTERNPMQLSYLILVQGSTRNKYQQCTCLAFESPF